MSAPAAFSAAYSSASLHFDEQRTVVKRRGAEGDRPAALVPIDRAASGPFTLAVAVDDFPAGGYPLYVGVGRAMPRDGAVFGLVEGTCGLRQHAWHEESRFALSNDFGVRTDAADESLLPSIATGSRVALQLSSADRITHCRTLRFFIDGMECAAFGDIADVGVGDEPWVAGLNPPEGSVLRLVTPRGEEVWSEASHAAFMQRLQDEENRRKSIYGVDS